MKTVIAFNLISGFAKSFFFHFSLGAYVCAAAGYANFLQLRILSSIALL